VGRRPNWLTKSEWKRTAHADGPAVSLWWYRLPTAQRDAVITAYVKQCSRGRTLPEGFRDELESWLHDLNTEQRVSPRKRRWWTVPSYALANKLDKFTLMKRFRELEKIAKRLYPSDVPVGRVAKPLTEEKVAAIRARFVELNQDMNAFAKVAEEFGIDPFRVGQLCKDLKADAVSQRQHPESGNGTTFDPTPDDPLVI
jgi:hypothetical protein